MGLIELYNLKLLKYKINGEKERPAKLLAMLLLPEKDKYEPLMICEGEFYNKYKKEIDLKIKKVINDFEISKEEIIKYIEDKDIVCEDFEHDKVWYVFSEGFGAMHWSLMYHPEMCPEEVYEKVFSKTLEKNSNRNFTDEKILELRTKFNNIKKELELLKSNQEVVDYIKNEDIAFKLDDDDIIKMIATNYKNHENQCNIYIYMGSYRYDEIRDTFELIENNSDIEGHYLLYYNLLNEAIRIKVDLSEKEDFEKNKIIIKLKNPNLEEYRNLKNLYFKELIYGSTEEETLVKVKEKYMY